MTVSISHRVFDAAETTRPATVCALLRELGMSHACVEKQKAALGTWLMIHERSGRCGSACGRTATAFS